MGLESILSIKVSITIDTMFDGDGHLTCKQTLTVKSRDSDRKPEVLFSNKSFNPNCFEFLLIQKYKRFTKIHFINLSRQELCRWFRKLIFHQETWNELHFQNIAKRFLFGKINPVNTYYGWPPIQITNDDTLNQFACEQGILFGRWPNVNRVTLKTGGWRTEV